MLLLDERIKPDGSHARTFAEAIGDDRVEIRDDDGARGILSLAAFDRVMCRYGRPLDETIALDGEPLVLGAYRPDGKRPARGRSDSLHCLGYRYRNRARGCKQALPCLQPD